MGTRHPGRNAAGGTRGTASDGIDHPAAVGPVASEVGLLRAYLAKRKYLDPEEIRMAEDYLRRAVERPLTAGQLRWLVRHAAMVAAVYESPPEVETPKNAVSVQPWGVLPKLPPRRTA